MKPKPKSILPDQKKLAMQCGTVAIAASHLPPQQPWSVELTRAAIAIDKKLGNRSLK